MLPDARGNGQAGARTRRVDGMLGRAGADGASRRRDAAGIGDHGGCGGAETGHRADAARRRDAGHGGASVLPEGLRDRRLTASTDDPLLLAFLRGMRAAAEVVAALPAHLDVSALGGAAALEAAAGTLRDVADSPEALLRASRTDGLGWLSAGAK